MPHRAFPSFVVRNRNCQSPDIASNFGLPLRRIGSLGYISGIDPYRARMANYDHATTDGC